MEDMRLIKLSTSELADALGVSPETIRYQARKGHIPFEVTPGKHRRFLLKEVKAALGQEDAAAPAEPTHGVVLALDFSEPHREMTDEAALRFGMSAGRDERALVHQHEKLDPVSPLAPFTVAGSARYAPARELARVSGASG